MFPIRLRSVRLFGAVAVILLGALLGNVIGIGVSAVMSGNGAFGGTGVGRGSSFGGFQIVFAPLVTPSLILLALFFGVLVSLVFTLYPAWRASKLTPVDALRSE